MKRPFYFFFCAVFLALAIFPSLSRASQIPTQGLVLGMQNGMTTVLRVYPQSAGFMAGFQPGDGIVSVNDTPTNGMTPRDVSYLLDFNPGGYANVSIVRNGVTHTLPLQKQKPEDQWKLAERYDAQLAYQRYASMYPGGIPGSPQSGAPDALAAYSSYRAQQSQNGPFYFSHSPYGSTTGSTTIPQMAFSSTATPNSYSAPITPYASLSSANNMNPYAQNPASSSQPNTYSSGHFSFSLPNSPSSPQSPSVAAMPPANNMAAYRYGSNNINPYASAPQQANPYVQSSPSSYTGYRASDYQVQSKLQMLESQLNEIRTAVSQLFQRIESLAYNLPNNNPAYSSYAPPPPSPAYGGYGNQYNDQYRYQRSTGGYASSPAPPPPPAEYRRSNASSSSYSESLDIEQLLREIEKESEQETTPTAWSQPVQSYGPGYVSNYSSYGGITAPTAAPSYASAAPRGRRLHEVYWNPPK